MKKKEEKASFLNYPKIQLRNKILRLGMPPSVVKCSPSMDEAWFPTSLPSSRHTHKVELGVPPLNSALKNLRQIMSSRLVWATQQIL